MTKKRVSIFPLASAIVFPGMQLPLHIFEPRYRSMISDSLARDRLIGMVQPRTRDEPAPVYSVGTLCNVAEFEILDDGRYNIMLDGIARFTITQELEVTTPFRQAEAEVWVEVENSEILSIAERAALERASRSYADKQGYAVDWAEVSKLDDYALVNAIAQIAPFDAAAKQALLETRGLGMRSELIIQMMQFFGRHDGSSDSQITLQ